MVAVPFGQCTEPSNVSAGGNACPVRFQCHGCSFFRVDPSYLPELDRHIAEIKTNLAEARRMAMPAWVLENLSQELEAYITLRNKMQSKLDDLPPAEREEIDAASEVLRRARHAKARGLSLSVSAAQPTQGIVR